MKKIMKFAFVTAIVAVAGYNVYKSQSVMNGMSEFALANVEALAADDETSDDLRIIPCPDSYWNECNKSPQNRPKCSTKTECP